MKRPRARPGARRVIDFIYAIVGALLVTLILIVLIMSPPAGDLLYLALFLAGTGAISAVIGVVFQRLGWWQAMPSLRHALTAGYVIAAGLTLLNVWITAELMFVNPHDLALAVLLLVFAGAVAVAFGYYLSGAITEALSDVAGAARRISGGDFSTRIELTGSDEVAQLAGAFNLMASELERAAAEADALDEARRNLVAWASHDLRTPLASLRAMIDALADGVVSDPATVDRYLKQSQAEIARMSTLIDDLFQLAQIDAAQLELDCEPGSLSDLISDTLSAFSAQAKAQQVTLQGTVSPAVDPVWMASDKVSRVLYNLLGNALRYTPPGGRVTLEAIPEGDAVRVTVTDTGAGIDPADLPYIFDRFFRGEKSRSRGGYEAGGAGLGLAIAKGMVEAHGGRIWAESEPGECTAIHFTLPRRTSS